VHRVWGALSAEIILCLLLGTLLPYTRHHFFPTTGHSVLLLGTVFIIGHSIILLGTYFSLLGTQFHYYAPTRPAISQTVL